MAEEAGHEDHPSVDPSAAAIALEGKGALDPRAAAYLEKQGRLVDLQAKELEHELALRHWSLRVRHLSDVLKLTFELSGAILVVFVIGFVAVALWSASRAGGIVVDSFSVPPAFTQRGVTGDVVASDVADRLAEMRREVMAYAYASSGDVAKNSQSEVRLDIPDTGVSIGEVWRYLRDWLGHQQHVTGDLREGDDGTATLTIGLDGHPDIVESGTARDLAKLERRAAEELLRDTYPVSYIDYLAHENRWEDAYRAANDFAATAGSASERAISLTMQAGAQAVVRHEFSQAIAHGELAASLEPQLAGPHLEMEHIYNYLGRAEDDLREARAVLATKESDQDVEHRGGGFALMRAEETANVDGLLGDFAKLDKDTCTVRCALGDGYAGKALAAAYRHDDAHARELLARAVQAGDADPRNVAEAQTALAINNADWSAARHAARAGVASFDALPLDDAWDRFSIHGEALDLLSFEAVAEARAGETGQAAATIALTNGDCYDCLLARGRIDAAEGNTNGAAFWFADAVHQAPSIPFAYAAWGEMLLREGRYDAAIVEFKLANAKGPHFADPIEMWGEALMAKNRSDLALAKFTEADQYAPNWGRLHLKWGEALFYAGKPDEAKKQFAVAARLDLSPADKAALEHWMKSRG
jgi:tetratricopeptide (TPR) repeat protein